MRRFSGFGLWLIAGLAAAAGPQLAAARAGEISIQPHSAVYRLEMSALSAGSAISGVVGRMEFDWQETCDAWTVSQKLLMRISHGDGSEINFGWTMNTWEAKDQRNYRFFIRRLYENGGGEEMRGKAELGLAGKGEAIFSIPEERKLALPEGTLFPTQHIKLLLQSARDDWPPAVSLWRPVFDGSGDSGLYGVSATMVAALKPGEDKASELEMVRDLPSWRMRRAFFDLEQEQGLAPAHEQALRLYANGIVDELVLDYSEFSVRAILEDLKPVAEPRC